MMRIRLSENEIEPELLNEHDKPVKDLTHCAGTIGYLVAGQVYIDMKRVDCERQGIAIS